jgi:hypothetical protein
MAENSLALQSSSFMEDSKICINGLASINAFLIIPSPLILAEIFKICPCKSHEPDIVVSLVMETAEARNEMSTDKKKRDCFKE